MFGIHISSQHGGECGKTFKDKKLGEKHFESLHSIPQECDDCGLVLVDTYNLKEHKKKYHSISKAAPQHCDKCEATFDTQDALKAHTSKIHARLSMV